MRTLPVTIVILVAWLASASATIPLGSTPVWRSNEDSYYFTGATFSDVDLDGYHEFLSSAGNDMSYTYNFVWHNDGGVLGNNAWWVSSDVDYSGHCDAGDIDDDGYPDFAVSNYIAPGWGTTTSQVYFNTGGTFELTPSWVTSDRFHSFSCALGDPDGDGDLDLAFSCGEAYNNFNERNRIFFNNNGVLETSASWVSDYLGHCYDVYWVDVDRDGDLDLSFISSGGPIMIHYNNNGIIETTASWESAGSDNGNTICWGDVNNDGFLDLAAANNTQLGGDGYFEVYMNQGGTLETTPSWQSSTRGYGSSVTFCDFDFDGDIDLAAGRWWGYTVVYENQNGTFTSTPTWTCNSYYGSVVEEFCLADVDADGVREVAGEKKPVDGTAKVFYLLHSPVHEITYVKADGVELPISDWCCDLEAGWISLANAPQQSLEVGYSYSIKPDLGVSNWDRENYVFGNNLPFSGEASAYLRPHDIPIALPSSGGYLSYDATVINNGDAADTFDAWLMAELPNGSMYGPIRSVALTIPAKNSISAESIVEDVPNFAPNGTYRAVLYIGTYPDAPVDSSAFTFTKGL